MKDLFHTTGERNTWSKREDEWYTIEERFVFKNNVKNLKDGDKKCIGKCGRAHV